MTHRFEHSVHKRLIVVYLNAIITKFEKIPVIFSFINDINIWFSLAIDMQIVLYAFIQYIFILQNFYSLFHRKLR